MASKKEKHNYLNLQEVIVNAVKKNKHSDNMKDSFQNNIDTEDDEMFDGDETVFDGLEDDELYNQIDADLNIFTNALKIKESEKQHLYDNVIEENIYDEVTEYDIRSNNTFISNSSTCHIYDTVPNEIEAIKTTSSSIYENTKPLYDNLDFINNNMEVFRTALRHSNFSSISTSINSTTSISDIELKSILELPAEVANSMSYDKRLQIFEKMVAVTKENIKDELINSFNLRLVNIKDVFSLETDKKILYEYWAAAARKYRDEGYILKYMLAKEKYKTLKREIREIKSEDKLKNYF